MNNFFLFTSNIGLILDQFFIKFNSKTFWLDIFEDFELIFKNFKFVLMQFRTSKIEQFFWQLWKISLDIFSSYKKSIYNKFKLGTFPTPFKSKLVQLRTEIYDQFFFKFKSFVFFSFSHFKISVILMHIDPKFLLPPLNRCTAGKKPPINIFFISSFRKPQPLVYFYSFLWLNELSKNFLAH